MFLFLVFSDSFSIIQCAFQDPHLDSSLSSYEAEDAGTIMKSQIRKVCGESKILVDQLLPTETLCVVAISLGQETLTKIGANSNTSIGEQYVYSIYIYTVYQ